MHSKLQVANEVIQGVSENETAARFKEAVEGYRVGQLSLGQVALLLNTSPSEAGEILAAHGCHSEQSEEEIAADVISLRDVLRSRHSRW